MQVSFSLDAGEHTRFSERLVLQSDEVQFSMPNGEKVMAKVVGPPLVSPDGRDLSLTLDIPDLDGVLSRLLGC